MAAGELDRVRHAFTMRACYTLYCTLVMIRPPAAEARSKDMTCNHRARNTRARGGVRGAGKQAPSALCSHRSAVIALQSSLCRCRVAVMRE